MNASELLELAKKAQFSSKDGMQFTPDQTKYISEMSPAIMIPLLERYLAMEEKYYQLLYVVEDKYPGESRHQTALRYLTERANRCDNTAKQESQ